MSIKRALFGPPIPTDLASHQQLTVGKGIVVFTPDGLSSSLYAYEAVLLILAAGGSVALKYGPMLALITVGLLAIVVLSYRQTINAYPDGGGGYRVATINLGRFWGLISAWSLMANYVLTVAVSLSAGVAALNSMALTFGAPWLADFAVPHALFWLVIITWASKRGVNDSASYFVVLTYSWIGLMVGMLAFGWAKLLMFGPESFVVSSHAVEEATDSFSLFLMLRAFSAGAALLTGTEATSNGVPYFKEPAPKHAKQVITIFLFISAFIALSIAFQSTLAGIQPYPESMAEGRETLVSQLAKAIFGTTAIGSVFYILVQLFSALILLMACLTSYMDFPRLAMMVAKDRYLHHGFRELGDRLTYDVGIWVLAAFSGLFIILYNAHESRMLPLYAVGGFTCFVLSQSGMVVHHLREKQAGWVRSLAINATGAVACFVILGVLFATKWSAGAWQVVLLILGMVYMSYRVNLHYERTRVQLRKHGQARIQPVETLKVVLTESLNELTDDKLSVAINKNTPTYVVHIANEKTQTVLDGWFGHNYEGVLRRLRSEGFQVMPHSNPTAAEIQLLAKYGYTEGTGDDAQEYAYEYGAEPYQISMLRVVANPLRDLGTVVRELADYYHRLHPEMDIQFVIGNLVANGWWHQTMHGGSNRVIEDALADLDYAEVVEVPWRIDNRPFSLAGLFDFRVDNNRH